MYRVEMYARVRRACRVEGMSTREASRVFGLDRKTVRKMLSFSVPPGYRRGKPPRRPKLGPFNLADPNPFVIRKERAAEGYEKRVWPELPLFKRKEIS